jgi:HD superfamily phosphodiesterase
LAYTGGMRKLIQQYAKDLTAGRLASGYEHSYRVYHLARELGEDLDYDEEILHAACFLHDIEMASGHPESSAAKARAILQETGFRPGKIQGVYSAILEHMPGGEAVEPEGKLLHDANLLDTLGAVGMARLSVGSFLWYHAKTMCQVLELWQRWLGHAEFFYFPKSRELAAEKVRFMQLAVEQMTREFDL